MIKRILLPVEDSAISQHAVSVAVELARACQAQLIALHVILPERAEQFVLRTGRPHDHDDALLLADRFLSTVREEAERSGVSCDSCTMYGGEPWDAIVQAAREKACDLIIMGTHRRRGIAHLLLGSETQSVLLHSEIPVLVCP